MAGGKFKVEWTDDAVLDLVEIVAHIAHDSPGAAERLLEKLRRQAGSLETLP